MGHNNVVSGHPKSIVIPRVDGLSTRPPGFVASQLLKPKNKVFSYRSKYYLFIYFFKGCLLRSAYRISIRTRNMNFLLLPVCNYRIIKNTLNQI